MCLNLIKRVDHGVRQEAIKLLFRIEVIGAGASSRNILANHLWVDTRTTGKVTDG